MSVQWIIALQTTINMQFAFHYIQGCVESFHNDIWHKMNLYHFTYDIWHKRTCMMKFVIYQALIHNIVL